MVRRQTTAGQWNGEVKRRTNVVWTVPFDIALRRIVGTILVEQAEKRTVQRAQYITPDT